ncbi:MAG: class I SAM-dependent methyltransferase [Candidatus Adlerbacteria bacterium]|nr:class I SAM-dependent methyltransferase [Candidatus Adlerbacteria bacterium]
MKCDLCFQETATEFLDLGLQPLANKYPTEEMFAKEDFFPLKVFFCTNCKNVQLGTKVSRERMFEDYYYLSSVNQGLVRHFNEFAKQLTGKKLVIDVGSNDGILLKPLRELGVKAVGIEPSINVGKIANDSGLETIISFFDTKSVEEVKAKYGPADVVVASSIFTHLEDPHQFIEDVKLALTEDGEFIIEVEYIGNMLRDIQFERFYLDRIFYYSLTSLRDLFALHGMYVGKAEHIEPHGGSLRVTGYKKDKGPGVGEAVKKLLAEEASTLTPETLKEFSKTVDEYLSFFKTKLEEYKKQGVRVAGYGAPARVATICNYGKIGPDLIEFIVDDSPLKQNRFSPGTHIPIKPKNYLEGFEQKPDLLVVFAYEYFDDIKKKTQGKYRYLIAIPPREVV